MPRPKKHDHERRSESVRSDLTIAEKCFVQEQAAKAGLSEAAFVRHRVLGYVVRAKAAHSAFDPALVSEINRLGNQLAALGNNANQIALYCHTDRQIPADWAGLPSEIRALERVIEKTLERIVISGSKDSCEGQEL